MTNEEQIKKLIKYLRDIRPELDANSEPLVMLIPDDNGQWVETKVDASNISQILQRLNQMIHKKPPTRFLK